MSRKKKRPAGRPAGRPGGPLVEEPPTSNTGVGFRSPASAGSPLELVRGLGRTRLEIDRQLVAAVAAARRRGETWRDLGDALGVTPQAVQKRYGRQT